MIRKGLTAATAILTAQAASAQDFDLAITNVDIVNVETGAIEADRTVVIEDGKISLILPAEDARPETVETIDGTDKFLIPGLIDMHVHMNRDSLPLFLRFGVTTVRDMGTHFAELEPGSGGQLAIREEIAAGTLDGPELILALRILDGDIPRNPQWAMHYASIATPEEGRALVNQVADAMNGCDVVVHCAFGSGGADETRWRSSPGRRPSRSHPRGGRS